MTTKYDPCVTYDSLRERFADVFQHISERAVQREQNRELAYDAVEALRGAGFGALRVPKHLGGAGVTLPQLFRLLIDLGEADSNLPQIIRAHFGFVEGQISARDQVSQAYWLSKVASGQLWGAAMAERSGTSKISATITASDSQDPGAGWKLNGEKYYSTGTLYADWIVAVAADGDDPVSMVVGAKAPGVTCADDWDGFGQRLTGSGTTQFNNVAVPSEHIIRRFSAGEQRAEAYLSAFYQLFHLANLAGIARAVLRDATDFVKGRTRGFGIPGQSEPRNDPLVQRIIGRLSSLAYSAETMVWGVADVLENVHQAELENIAQEKHYVEADIRVFQAQQIVLAQVLEATTLLFEVGGASATSETLRFDRHWRNARTLASHNPSIYRERALGDYYLNEVIPGSAPQTTKADGGIAGNAPDSQTQSGGTDT